MFFRWSCICHRRLVKVIRRRYEVPASVLVCRRHHGCVVVGPEARDPEAPFAFPRPDVYVPGIRAVVPLIGRTAQKPQSEALKKDLKRPRFLKSLRSRRG